MEIIGYSIAVTHRREPELEIMRYIRDIKPMSSTQQIIQQSTIVAIISTHTIHHLHLHIFKKERAGVRVQRERERETLVNAGAFLS